MTPTFRFALFCGIGIASLLAGYYSRKKNLVSEDMSRKVHFHTVLWVWTVGGVLSLWLMVPQAQQLWLFLIVPGAMAFTTAVAVFLGRRLNMGRSQIGALAVGAGISNTGSTLGAYIAYILIQPHDQALAYASAACYMMLFMSVALVYPVAQHFAGPDARLESPWKLVVKSYIDIRSVGLWSCVFGLLLALAAVPFPRVLLDWYALDVIAYLAAFGGYFGIGLKLRLGESRAYLREHLSLALIKFLICPIFTLVLIGLIGLFFKPLPHMETHVLMLQSAAPAGISMVIVANLFHLDSRMASIVWLWNTLVYLVLVLPVTWLLLRLVGG